MYADNRPVGTTGAVPAIDGALLLAGAGAAASAALFRREPRANP